MTTWILIFFISTKAGQITATPIEFKSEASCKNAADALKFTGKSFETSAFCFENKEEAKK